MEKYFEQHKSDVSEGGEAEGGFTNKVKAIVKKESPQLATFSGDSSLEYIVSPNGETFVFYPKTYQVEVPAKWFQEKDYSPEGIRFALYHELGHFIDMRKNPQAYISNFEYMRAGEANKKISFWLEDKLLKDDVDENEIKRLTEEQAVDEKGTKMSRLQQLSYKYLHTMYNILDDVAVNNLVAQKAPFYSQESGEKEIERVYIEKLGFEEHDLRDRPRHVQLMYSILRDEMLPSREKSVTSEEVEEVVNNKKLLGKTLRELINERIKPKSGNLGDPGKRYKLIQAMIEPIYLDLLKKDIDDLDLNDMQKEEQEQQKKKGKSQEGEKESDKDEGEEEENGEDEEGGKNDEHRSKPEKTKEKKEREGGEGELDFDPFKKDHERSDDPDRAFTEEEINKMLDEFREAKEYREATPEERSEKDKEKLKAEFDKIYGISQETRSIFESIVSKIREPRKEMRNFWKNLIGESIELKREKISGQRRGNVNIDDYIKNYPEVIEGERSGNLDKLNIYETHSSKVESVSKPERIEVSLVADMSGSMNTEKIDALHKATALLLLSLKDFNDYLDRERKSTKSKLSAYSEVYAFGSTFNKVKEFKDKSYSKRDEQAQIVKTFNYLQTRLGGTNDAAVLSEIISSVDEEKSKNIKKGKEKKIVFEITDGQPNDDVVGHTKERVTQMIEKDIIPIAFQIGNVTEAEKTVFEHIWNEGRDVKCGIFIGEDIEKLPHELIKVLKSKFGNIRL